MHFKGDLEDFLSDTIIALREKRIADVDHRRLLDCLEDFVHLQHMRLARITLEYMALRNLYDMSETVSKAVIDRMAELKGSGLYFFAMYKTIVQSLDSRWLDGGYETAREQLIDDQAWAKHLPKTATLRLPHLYGFSRKPVGIAMMEVDEGRETAKLTTLSESDTCGDENCKAHDKEHRPKPNSEDIEGLLAEVVKRSDRLHPNVSAAAERLVKQLHDAETYFKEHPGFEPKIRKHVLELLHDYVIKNPREANAQADGKLDDAAR